MGDGTEDAGAAPRRWAHRAFERIPTGWLVTAGTGAALAATAAFGGLAAVATPVPVVAVGDAYEGAGLEMTVLSASLSDDPRGTFVAPEEGERVLRVELDARNLGTTPRGTVNATGVDAVRIDGGPDEDPWVSRRDDDTTGVQLQPRVGAPLLLTWIVPADAYHDGDELVLLLPAATEHDLTLSAGTGWQLDGVGARVTLVVSDAGDAP
ncbi:hypothetical protein [Microbacterium pseudoresistens]|uniref:DUF4352 domain-containing protein n=1 Tax=Microbacterium pseudoresistens TaxID=640634 RepID=A0A7Y9EUY5_9MICO|nr:hypothetical protein [Microbacterium pseudoresistens]NYD54420.1 hypothetical protein [Microbacterium pseudoresistens]